jgi:large subunit ribosomal protein L10
MPENYTTKVRPEKVEAVDEIKSAFGEQPTVVLTEYRGLSVEALKQLRAQLLAADTSYKVVKNTLARLAADDLGLGEIIELLTGPTAIAYVKGDPVAAAKVIATFAKDHPELVIKGGVLEGRIMTADETKGLATVDVLDVSRAKIAGLLTAALRQITYTLEAPLRQMMYVLQEVSKRAPQAEAPAEEEGTQTEQTQEGESDGDS